MRRTLIRGYKTELDLNNTQRTACLKHAGAARWAYNWGLSRKKDIYEQTGRSLGARELHKELNVLKQTEIPWMYEVSKAAPQEALRDLDKAFQNFFRSSPQKKGRAWGYPQYKSKKHGINSFRLTGVIHVFDEAIQLPRLGMLRLKEHGYLPVNAHVLSATVSHQAGRWYVSVQIRQEQPEPLAATADPLGIDLGVKVMATMSDGRVCVGPKALSRYRKTLRKANKRLHRRQQGSKNRKKAQKNVARLHARIAHIRRDALHQVTSRLIHGNEPDRARQARKDALRATFPEAKTKQERKWQEKQIKKDMRLPTEEQTNLSPCVVVIEDLNVSGMQKNHHLARAVSDVGMHEFRRQLLYKAEQAGCEVLIASRWFASSKTCSGCGWIDEEQTLADRVFVCQECHACRDRDLNASLNLVMLAYDVRWDTATSA